MSLPFACEYSDIAIKFTSQSSLHVMASGVVLVMVCATVVYWDNGGTIALYIDPALAVTSAAILMWFSYPYGISVFFGVFHDGLFRNPLLTKFVYISRS